VWRQVLPSMGGSAYSNTSRATQLAVVRIEDLVGANRSVIHTPEADGHDGMMLLNFARQADLTVTSNLSTAAAAITNNILSRIGLHSVAAADVHSQLAAMHLHADDYGGGLSHQSLASMHSVAHLMASFSEVHDVMLALGYNPYKYGRWTPSAPEVITT